MIRAGFSYFDSDSKRPEKQRGRSSYHQDESTPKNQRKNRRRTYRDESGEPSTSKFSPFESGFHASEIIFPSVNSNDSKSTKVTPEDTDSSKYSGEDKSQDSSYSSEEAAGEKSAERSVLENLESFDY